MVKNLSFSEQNTFPLFGIIFADETSFNTFFFAVKPPPSSGETVEPSLPILDIPSQKNQGLVPIQPT